MAFQYVSSDGVLIIPGAYPTVTIKSTSSALATTGVLMLIGEADAGPDYSAEEDLSLNSYGPDQSAEVMSKYKSGPLVDAFKGAVAAANDPAIVGSFSRCILVKPNVSTQASGTLVAYPSGNWGKITDKSYGKLGNLIAYSVTAKQAESLPTTGSCLLLPPQVTTVVAFRVNGGAEVTTSITAATLPTAMVSAINGLSGILATGGANRGVITSVAGTLTLTQLTGNSVSVVNSTPFAAMPTAGDVMYIPTGSPFAAANEGSYVVTAIVGTTTIYAYKLLDAAGTGAVLTPPTTEAPVSIAATTDLQAFAPAVITLEASDPSSGLGKTLEVAESGSEHFNRNVYVFVSAIASPPAAAATWVSKTGSPYVLTSVAEYVAQLNVGRQYDGIIENVYAGGSVSLTLGYTGTTASAVIANGVMTITTVGGLGLSPAAINLADYPTISDLCTYLNTLTGFTAAPATALVGQYLSINLDPGTYNCGTSFGAKTGRIKQDGYKFGVDINASSVLINVAAISPATVLVGLPKLTSATAFLSGGTVGYTTDAIITAALTALEACRGNFIIPLFSRDASADIADGLTDSNSTYTIAGINAACRAHVLAMSTRKRRRNRQALLSIKDTFTNAKIASANLASYRCNMTFQDVKDINAYGSIKQFQPWMGAVKAGAMQAAGFYKPIVHKYIACSGALQAAGDFKDQNDTDVEDALLSGLLPIRRSETGGYFWVSDQTTYGKDDNFAFNSLQVTYASDTVALTAARRMEDAFVGQSQADVSATMAKSTFESILDDMRRLKLIAPSDDAPTGYKNVIIRITGYSMVVSAEIKISGAILFIPISFMVSQVQQTAQ